MIKNRHIRRKVVLKHLKKIRKYKKKEHAPILYKVHKKYGISKKTLFYVKEYGSHANVIRTVLKESIKILLLASVISSLGGFALEHIKAAFISLVPLVVLLPALNDMIGDYGTIISSKFATMIHTGKVKGGIWANRHIKKLFIQMSVLGFLTALLSGAVALIISGLFNFALTVDVIYKVFLIAVIDVMLLVAILFAVAVVAGLYFYRKKEDPNNFLIPITTSVADFGNMIMLALLIIAFF